MDCSSSDLIAETAYVRTKISETGGSSSPPFSPGKGGDLTGSCPSLTSFAITVMISHHCFIGLCSTAGSRASALQDRTIQLSPLRIDTENSMDINGSLMSRSLVRSLHAKSAPQLAKPMCAMLFLTIAVQL